MSIDIEKERVEFEAWLLQQGYSIEQEGGYDEETGIGPVYGPAEHCGWHAWLTAKASQTKPEPVTLTDEELHQIESDWYFAEESLEHSDLQKMTIAAMRAKEAKQ